MPDWQERYSTMLYTVSHDFGAPLRHVQAFAELLEVEAGATLTPEQADWLDHVVRAGTLAQAMLAGLLRVSRVYTQPGMASESTVAEAAAVLEGATCPPGLSDRSLTCNLATLRQAFDELKANAETYGGGATVVLEEMPGLVMIRVLNQEGGIPEDQWERALVPFQRLGKQPSVDHVGVGLTYAASVAEAAGGCLGHLQDGVEIRLPIA